MHVNVERLLCETPLSVEPSSLEAIHQRLFGPAKRRAPDHYEIHEELGRGGFGRVYRSTDKRYPREVALKVIPYHGARQLARLEREARALAGLAHPNIVSVFDKGIADAGIYFLAIERVTGTRLDEWMHAPARRLDEIIEIFAQAAEGLQHAHQRGMIHRDFKPSNAIVDEDGRLRILDFGLVEIADEVETASEASEAAPEQDDSLTSASYTDPTRSSSSDWSHGDGAAALPEGSRVPGFRGTLAYAAPEQLEGGREVDPRTDQFSLCVALFEACHGFRPFSGRTVLELSEQISTGTLARGQSRHRIPRWLERLLRRGLSPNPAERYEHVGAIAAILRAHLRPKPWLAMAAGVALTLGLAASAYAVTRPPMLDLPEDIVWPEGDPDRISTLYGPGLVEDLEGYRLAWKGARDLHAEAPDREAEDAAVLCLRAGEQQFQTFVARLDGPAEVTVPPPLASERIWLAQISDPEDCLVAERREPVSDAVVTELLEAQAARLAGRYAEALERLDLVRDDAALQQGRPSALFGYELGLVQLRLGDSTAWRTLAAAAQDVGDDRALLVEVMARQLEAGVMLEAAEPAELDTLLWLLRRRAEAAGPVEALAEGFVLFQKSRYGEARRSFARACEAYAALEPSPYRNLVLAQCTLNQSYAGSHEQPQHIDADALEPALAHMRALLGEQHPLYLRHAIKVARLLADVGRLESSRRLLASTLAKVDADSEVVSSFDILRARAELLESDLVQSDYGEGLVDRDAKVAAWSAAAIELETLLDARDEGLTPLQRSEAYRVREILLSAHSVANDELRVARTLDRLWKDTVLLGKVADTCAYAKQFLDRSDDEKKQVSEEIVEIEARLRTRCGSGVDDRPKKDPAPAIDERTPSK